MRCGRSSKNNKIEGNDHEVKIWGSSCIIVETRVIQDLDVPIRLCGCEKVTEMKIQTFETKYIWRLLQISYREQKTSEFVGNAVADLTDPWEPLLATVKR